MSAPIFPLAIPGEVDANRAIAVGGRLFDIGTRVIRWDQHGGFDGYTRARVDWDEEDRKTGKVVHHTIKGPRYGSRAWAGDPLRKIRQLCMHHSGGDGPDASGLYETLWNRRVSSLRGSPIGPSPLPGSILPVRHQLRGPCRPCRGPISI